MSDTPRTFSSDFARQLDRKLVDLTKERDAWQECADELRGKLETQKRFWKEATDNNEFLKRENNSLRAELRKAKQSLSDAAALRNQWERAAFEKSEELEKERDETIEGMRFWKGGWEDEKEELQADLARANERGAAMREALEELKALNYGHDEARSRVIERGLSTPAPALVRRDVLEKCVEGLEFMLRHHGGMSHEGVFVASNALTAARAELERTK